MKIQIKARITDAVLFECEISDDTPARYRIREALQKGVSARADLAGANLAGAYLAGADLADAYLARANLARAYLAGANLAGANLAGANLARAYLAGAYLARAYLAGADLAGADLAGANLAGANFDIKPASSEEAIANLDKVREIVLENRERLEMGHWHGDTQWRARTCAEEATCGTTHCLAGWLQVCSTDERVRALTNPQLAGTLAAPIAASMFFKDQGETLKWLQEREYAA